MHPVVAGSLLCKERIIYEPLQGDDDDHGEDLLHLLLSWIGLADMVRIALVAYSTVPIRLTIETILADGQWLIGNKINLSFKNANKN